MSIRIVRLGSPRVSGEGVRLGTVRRPPRGVKKEEFAKRDYFDVWLPELAPSAPLVSYALSQEWTAARWAAYARRYRREMAAPAAGRLLTTLALLSREANFSVGCYCENERRCHRSILRELLQDHAAVLSE
jgi:uncharacterized protein YeaO (DUF488 family)